MDKTARMKELIAILNEASRAYYAQDREIMSNYEYDKLYDELVSLEEETGTVMAGSRSALAMRRLTNCLRSGMKVPCFPWEKRKAGKT